MIEEEVEDLEELGEDEPEQEQEMYEHFRLEVDPGQNLLRIDRLPNVSRTKIQEAAEAQCVQVNNKPVKSNYRVKPKDIVTLMLPHPKREIRVIPEDIPLNIVYEDDYLLVINKEPGMVVHPSYGHYTGTLVNALAWHLKGNPLFKENDPRPGLVHRIDKACWSLPKRKKLKPNCLPNFSIKPPVGNTWPYVGETWKMTTERLSVTSEGVSLTEKSWVYSRKVATTANTP